MLNKRFSESEIFPNKAEIKQNNKSYPALRLVHDMSFDRLNNLKLINGHYLSNSYRHLPFDLKLLVFPRAKRAYCPICVLLKSRSSEKKTISLEDIFEQKSETLANTQIRYIAEHLIINQGLLEMDRANFEEAILPVLKQFSFIGISERFDESIKLFEKTFGMKLSKPIKANKASVKDKPSDQLKARIEELTIKEKWLYELVLKEFESRLNG